MQNIYIKNQYFAPDVISLTEDEVFVDGGAFTGDTLEDFIQATGGNYKKYYAFEPDKNNFILLSKKIENDHIKNVLPVENGLYNENKLISFSGDNRTSSSIDSNGTFTIEVNSVDNLCNDATFIKMDIEGVELEALKGSKQTIISNKPKLAICIYHKKEHLTEILLYIKSLRPDYKFYMRQHSKVSSAELVLYAV